MICFTFQEIEYPVQWFFSFLLDLGQGSFFEMKLNQFLFDSFNLELNFDNHWIEWVIDWLFVIYLQVEDRTIFD